MIIPEICSASAQCDASAQHQYHAMLRKEENHVFKTTSRGVPIPVAAKLPRVWSALMPTNPNLSLSTPNIYFWLLASSRHRDYDSDMSSQQVAMVSSGNSAQVMGNRR